MNARKILKVLLFVGVYSTALTWVDHAILSPAGSGGGDDGGLDHGTSAPSESVAPSLQPPVPTFESEEGSPVPTEPAEQTENINIPTDSESPAETASETEAATETAEPTPDQSNPSVVSPYYGANEYGSPYENGVLSNSSYEWYFMSNADGQPPKAQRYFDMRPFGGYYLGDINNKYIYLTFDEGYENGYTAALLDILKEKGVKAAFFVTKTYIRDNQLLIIRMEEEGHIVANHSVSHRSSPDLTDEEFAYELEETARFYLEIVGRDMGRYFRPPMGDYSARTIKLAQDLGYKTVFWSFAYKDWLVDAQPGKQAAFDMITSRAHNGCIMLLHAVSQTNTEVLPDVIEDFRAKGYSFRTLDELK